MGIWIGVFPAGTVPVSGQGPWTGPQAPREVDTTGNPTQERCERMLDSVSHFVPLLG